MAFLLFLDCFHRHYCTHLYSFVLCLLLCVRMSRCAQQLGGRGRMIRSHGSVFCVRGVSSPLSCAPPISPISISPPLPLRCDFLLPSHPATHMALSLLACVCDALAFVMQRPSNADFLPFGAPFVCDHPDADYLGLLPRQPPAPAPHGFLFLACGGSIVPGTCAARIVFDGI